MSSVTTNHTSTYRHRRVTIVTTTGERVSGRFIERRKNGRVSIRTAGGIREFWKTEIHQFLSGNNTRGAL